MILKIRAPSYNKPGEFQLWIINLLLRSYNGQQQDTGQWLHTDKKRHAGQGLASIQSHGCAVLKLSITLHGAGSCTFPVSSTGQALYRMTVARFSLPIWRKLWLSQSFLRYKEVLPFSMTISHWKCEQTKNHIFRLRPLTSPGRTCSEVP